MNTIQTISTSDCSAGAAEASRNPTGAVAPSASQGFQAVLEWLPCGRLESVLLAVIYVLVVGGVLSACVAARVREPELFGWGRHLLSLERGLWMTVVLPVGGVALHGALHFARRGLVRRAIVALLVALLAGAAFVAAGAIDYDSKAARRLVPGVRFKPSERYVARRFGVRLPADWGAPAPAARGPIAAAAPVTTAKREVSAASGREVFLRVCASCHGVHGEGLKGSGKELRVNEFVSSRDDGKLVDFLKTGRQPWDAENTTKVQMPGRGGDPRVTDDDLRDVVAYLREMQKRYAEKSDSSGGGTTTEPASEAAAGQAPASQAVEEPSVFIMHRSYLPDAPEGPRGLSPAYVAKLTRPAWAVPENAQTFFGVYFALTGLGGLHVLGAWALVVVTLVAALRRPRTITAPVRLSATAAVWWWATACWGLVYLLVYA